MTEMCEQAKAERETAEREARSRRRCFWTWPLGHCWHWNGGWMAVKCCRCGAEDFVDHILGPVSSRECARGAKGGAE